MRSAVFVASALWSIAATAEHPWSRPGHHNHTIPTEASADGHVALRQLESLVTNARTVAQQELAQRPSHARCNSLNVSVRREWGDLSASERIAYTNAVRCLQKKPAKSPASWAPGAKGRFDDWVATHIDQTLTIHFTGTFLGWHRYFTWEYEQALRNECGYRGTQPYWNWGISAISGLESSPIFDGSTTSMGSNGKKIDQTGEIVIAGGGGLTPVVLPTGSGGGCVQSGPFSDMTVNLGPLDLVLPGNKTETNPNGGLSYNPRCLKRDLTDYVNQVYANATATVNNIVRPQEVYDFQMLMQGVPGSGNIGVHGGGHFSFGGDPGRDLFSSPGEPSFYLHHGMIDLVWSTWQALDPQQRKYGDIAISGTGTFLNIPPSANTTFETLISLDYAGSGTNVTMRDVMSTIDGPFCYIYV